MSIDYRHPIRRIVTGARGKTLEAIIRTDKTYPVRQWARHADISHVEAGKLLREFSDLGITHKGQRGRNSERIVAEIRRDAAMIAGHPSVTIPSAETMLDKAIDLLTGAETLHADGNDHAALARAILRCRSEQEERSRTAGSD